MTQPHVPPSAVQSSLGRHSLWLLLALTALLYLPGTAKIPLMDRDEPRFAHATAEMMARDTWVIPYFNDAYRFDKPPLTYWWMRLHYHLLGMNEGAARLHSVFSVFAIAGLLFGIARRWYGLAGGWWAAGSWLTSLQVLVHGRLCVADMPMVLAVVVACWALISLWTEDDCPPRRRRLLVWSLWLSLGFGFLAKGPIAWFIPALACALARWVFWRRPLPWARLHIWPGAALTVLMVAAWGVPALLATRGAFWDVGIGEHIVKRGTDVLNGRAFVPGFYFLTALASLFPWIGLAAAGLRRVRQAWTLRTALLLAWLTAPYVLFFAYATQLPHYVMPGFPAFSLLLATAFSQPGALTPIPRLRLLWSVAALLGLVGVALIVVAATGPIADPRLGSLLGWAGALLVAIFPGGALALAAGLRHLRAGLALGFVVAAVLAGVCEKVADTLRETSLTLQAVALADVPREGEPPVAWEYAEPSLVFYADRPWKFTGGSIAKLHQALRRGKAPAIVALRREWTLDAWSRSFLSTAQLAATPPSKDFSSDLDRLLAEFPGWNAHTFSGFNAARTSWAEAMVLVPTPGRQPERNAEE